MFDRVLKFFLENSRVNYTLFVLIFAVGVWSYIKTPKEIFPKFELDMISIAGHYSGASIETLNKMAVKDIEDEVTGIDGVEDITTVISPGKFTIVLELKKGLNKYNTADNIKDQITTIKSNLPSDMDEPTVKVIELNKNLIDISISSSNISVNELKKIANKLKTKISSIPNIAESTIYGDSDKIYDIRLNESKIDAYGLNKSEVYNAISKLSYTFPLGKLETKGQHFYLSTYNGKKLGDDFAKTLLVISGKKVYLNDIATVEKQYEDSAKLFSINGQNALNLVIKQSETGNALVIEENVKKLVSKFSSKFTKVTFTLKDNNSEKIKDRLNIVISNIILGIILITILVAILINTRMAIIIAIGIPTSFVIASFYFYMYGYTINMISLVGVLLAIGIVVDDAIVVSENIQQKIEEGLPPKEAAYVGAKEMAKPVTIASLTTLFSFIPALMITGTMGEVIKLIPIALSALVIASLIESFIFLPIHATHTLKKDVKTLSWERANNFYSKIIHFLMRRKKTFLILFVVIVPLIMVSVIKMSKFQMFPRFDATSVNIAVKANVNTKVEDAFKIVQEIEKDIMKKHDEFYIQTVSSIAGFRKNNAGNTENFPYVMEIKVELQKKRADNFVDKYITPTLSFYYDGEGRTRDISSVEIARKIKKFLIIKDYKEKYNLVDISVVEKKVGPIKSDIKIGLISNNNEKIINAVNRVEKEINSLNGIKSTTNSITFGVDELKLKINTYGEKLGITEGYLGSLLINMYPSVKKATVFDKDGLVDVKIQRENDGNIEAFKNLEIPLSSGELVILKEIVEFKIIKSFETITKDKGEKNFYIYANVDSKIITATEVLDKLQPTLKELKKSGISIKLKGENEKKKALARDMMMASGLALVLIMLSMLYLFNSFKDTFILMSVIPFSFLGVLVGHMIMGLNLSMPSLIGGLGLAGVVVNDGIIMLDQLKRSKNLEELFDRASRRFRPIVLTSVTTLIGMSSLIFFPTGQAAIFQPMAIALGFGLAWGTILNLLYLPVLYTFANKLK